YYLDTKWNPSSILMYGSEKIVEGYPVKYDIEGNAIEVLVGKQVKLVKVSQVESLVWYDSVTMIPRAFVNAKEYSEGGLELSGLLEVLVDGNIPLIKRTTIWIKQPDYVVAFDVGNKDTQINKREMFYYAKGKEIFEINKKKQLIELFGDKGNEVNRYIKVNQLNTKEQRGLEYTFLYYNSLVSKE
ncbi:MAG: carboxypeptidase-like regulatory domain-containing protein, partial [Cyclobacteriaceae bacterium]